MVCPCVTTGCPAKMAKVAKCFLGEGHWAGAQEGPRNHVLHKVNTECQRIHLAGLVCISLNFMLQFSDVYSAVPARPL